MTDYKFKRHLSDSHKRRISEALTGRKLPQPVKDKISKKLKEIWDTIPYGDEDKKENTVINKNLKEN